jgi:hypothetical protein
MISPWRLSHQLVQKDMASNLRSRDIATFLRTRYTSPHVVILRTRDKAPVRQDQGHGLSLRTRDKALSFATTDMAVSLIA